MSEVSYTFQIDEDLKKKVEKIAENENRTLAGQIRSILEDFVEKKRWCQFYSPWNPC